MGYVVANVGFMVCVSIKASTKWCYKAGGRYSEVAAKAGVTVL